MLQHFLAHDRLIKSVHGGLLISFSFVSKDSLMLLAINQMSRSRG